MKHALALCLGILLAVAGCTAPRERTEHRVHSAAVVLGLVRDSKCSGTMISPPPPLKVSRLLLTAWHCVDGGGLLTVNNIPVNVVKIERDEFDAVWLTLDTDFPNHAPQAKAPLVQGDEVFIYGNPNADFDLLRRGYVTGISRMGSVLLDMRNSHGDSGSGVFNKRGEVAGVISSGYPFSAMTLTAIWPLGKPA